MSRRLRLTCAVIALLAFIVALAMAGCAKQETPKQEAPKAGEKQAEQPKAKAEKWPNKLINLVAIQGVGGGNDTMARGTQPFLQKYLGVSVTVDNRPGSGGIIATNYVHDQPADGHTLLWGANSLLLHTRLNKDSVKFKEPFLERFTPLFCVLNGDGNLVIGKSGSKFKSMDDVAAEAKQRIVKVGIGGGVGSLDHITYLQLTKAYPGKWSAIPFDSAGEAAAAVLGGHVDITLASLATQSVHTGQFNLLGLTLDERSPVAKNVPTFKELGKPEMSAISFRVGAFAPKGVPADRFKILEDAFKKSFDDPEFKAWAEKSKRPIGEKPLDSKAYLEFCQRFDKEVVDQILPDVQESLKQMQK